MSKPNLFDYATSELSQDAFICWLLAWASPTFKKNNSKLHNCGVKLLQSFFEKHGKELPVIEKIEVKKQDSNIDVLCIINNKYAILIEDKTRTKNHSNQLEKYLKEVQNRKEKYIVIPIYFKTYDQSNYDNVEKNHYKVFNRKDFINVLNYGKAIGVVDNIFEDFTNHLQAIEDRVQRYLTETPDKWNDDAWVGFYMHLQRELCDKGGWKKVPNKSGGFMGFWWCNEKDVYLQLEEHLLCFKIYVPEKDKQKKYRKLYYEILKKSKNNLNIPIGKPKRFGTGKFMTIMTLKNYLKLNNNGCIDIEKTISYLKSIELFLEAALEK